METKVTARAIISKWLARQQSFVGTLAENVVLPQSEQTAKRAETDMRTQQIHTKVLIDEKPTEKKVEHLPIFMVGISVLQIFFFYSFDDAQLTQKLGYDPHRRHEIWRFFTSMFVHSGYSHLWGNVVMQLVLGVFLETVHKWKRIAIIYLASVFGGSLCVTVLDNAFYSVGASGGVTGLLFSHLATIILNWNEIDKKFSRFFCVALYIVYDVGTDLYSELYLGEETNVSHATHFGGAVIGFLVSMLALKNKKKRPWEETMQKICVGILIAIVVICVTINVSVPNYFPRNEWNFRYEETYNAAMSIETVQIAGNTTEAYVTEAYEDEYKGEDYEDEDEEYETEHTIKGYGDEFVTGGYEDEFVTEAFEDEYLNKGREDEYAIEWFEDEHVTTEEYND